MSFSTDSIVSLSAPLQSLDHQLAYCVSQAYQKLFQVNFIEDIKLKLGDLDLCWDEEDGVGDVLISTKNGRSIVVGFGFSSLSFKGMEPRGVEEKDVADLVDNCDVHGLSDLILMLESEY